MLKNGITLIGYSVALWDRGSDPVQEKVLSQHLHISLDKDAMKGCKNEVQKFCILVF